MKLSGRGVCEGGGEEETFRLGLRYLFTRNPGISVNFFSGCFPVEISMGN